MNMERFFEQLKIIETEHSDFFRHSEDDILDHIAKGIFSSHGIVCADLPPEIMAKIRKVFNEIKMKE